MTRTIKTLAGRADDSTPNTLPKSWRRPWRASLILALLALIGSSVFVVYRYAWAEYHYRTAKRLLAEGVALQPQEHLTQARAHLALSLQVLPDSLEVNFLAARTARRLLAYDEADEYLRHYRKLGGVQELIDLETSLIRAQRGDLSQEIEDYLKSCVKNDHPDKGLILEALTRCYMQSFQIPSAAYCLDQWLELQPNAQAALLWRGQLWKFKTMYKEAIADFEQALQLDPACDDARLNLAELLIYIHKPKEAAENFEILTERLPSNSAVVLGLARCKAELGEIEVARRLLDKLIVIKPDEPQVLAEAGKLLLNNGQLAEALVRLREAHRLAPFERENLFNLHKCLVQLGQAEEAKKVNIDLERVDKDLEQFKTFRNQSSQTPRDPAPRVAAARILLRNAQYHEGRRWLDSAIQLDPKYAPARQLYADYFDRMGNPRTPAPQGVH